MGEGNSPVIGSWSLSEPVPQSCDFNECFSVPVFPVRETRRLQGAGVGYYLAFNLLGSNKIISLEGRSCYKEQNALGIFRDGYFSPPLPETIGKFSQYSL